MERAARFCQGIVVDQKTEVWISKPWAAARPSAVPNRTWIARGESGRGRAPARAVAAFEAVAEDERLGRESQGVAVRVDVVAGDEDLAQGRVAEASEGAL